MIFTKGRAKKFDKFRFGLSVRRDERRLDRRTKLFEKVLPKSKDELHVLHSDLLEQVLVAVLL